MEVFESKRTYGGFIHLFKMEGTFCVGYTEWIGCNSIEDFSTIQEYASYEEALYFFDEVWGR